MTSFRPFLSPHLYPNACVIVSQVDRFDATYRVRYSYFMKKNEQESEFLSTTQAAGELGVNQSRIRQLILNGQIPDARKFGRDWMIPRSALAALRNRKPGNPHKEKQ